MNEKHAQKKMMVLTCGGTVLGRGSSGDATGYESGVMDAREVFGDLMTGSDFANRKGAGIVFCHVCSKNSDDIGWQDRLRLLSHISDAMNDDETAGIVVLHGTDTMEETAFFLQLTTELKKPVVMTGAMRPATAVSPDGRGNLVDALAVAAVPEARDKGVLVVMDGRIYPAAGVTKARTMGSSPFESYRCAAGRVVDGQVFLAQLPDVEGPLFHPGAVSKPFPRVEVIFFHPDSGTGLLEYAIASAEGLVIAGAGAGEYSLEYLSVLEKADIPVVISSRVGDAFITEKMLLCASTIPAGGLQPGKAAILLGLCLYCGKDRDEIRAGFAGFASQA